MKVIELIKKLENMNPIQEIIFYNEQGTDLNNLFFEISHISKTDIESNRNKSGQTIINFKKTSSSKEVVVVELTSDF